MSLKSGSSTTRSYTYDTIGNPTKIVDTTGSATVTKNLDWKQGKQLASVTLPAGTKYFYYDESGRVKKTVLGSNTVKYHYDSDNLEYEEHYVNGSLSYIIKYFYDSQDRVQFALYKNQGFSGSTWGYNLYTYVYNGFGEITDIVRLREYIDMGNFDDTETLVAHYEYDPYGNIIKATTYDSDPFAAVNPIRYKAYYYDTDLSWYNLGARYYDPSVGRFINCDSLGVLSNTNADIINKNLYAYCNNNPIMYQDCDGDIPLLVVAVVVGTINLGLDIATTIIEGEEYDWRMGLGAFVAGAVSVYPGGVYVSTGISAITDIVIKEKSVEEACGNALMNVTAGGIGKKVQGVFKTAIGLPNKKDLNNERIGMIYSSFMTSTGHLGFSAIKNNFPTRINNSYSSRNTYRSPKNYPVNDWFLSLSQKMKSVVIQRASRR